MEQLKQASIFNKFAFANSRVLLIDGDPSFLSEVSEYMKLGGFMVDVAPDMQSAIKMGANS
ncbi:MAG: hypothetical protein NXI13_17435, partial [Proteobacteria bacterium]|nr:hypothetical protein [Pseudomonadota bacterium]MCR9215498.1 hypothetical protein [Pseudomonadota bacterium]